MKHKIAGLLGTIALIAGGLASANTLQDISYATAADGSVRVVLHLAEPASGAQAFTTDDPPRIAIDLPSTASQVVDRRIAVGNGAANSISAVEAGGRTRVVIDLFNKAQYQAYADGSTYVVEIAGTAGAAANATPGLAADPAKRINGKNAAITNVDFRRTPEGAARVLLDLSDENAIVDLRTEGSNVIIDLKDVDVAESLRQKLDVSDFATPAQFIETTQGPSGSRVTVRANGQFETLAYQTGGQYVLEVSPKKEIAPEDAVTGLGKDEQKGYTGEPVVFNFQEIPVRTLLQLLAEVSQKNIVAADTVTGNVTLRLINVPWDQALDIVLRSKGLDKRVDGNVIWVAPQSEIAKYEKDIAEARLDMEQRAPLLTEYIAINYGRAADIASLLTEDAKQSQGGAGGGQAGQRQRGFLSPRGSVSFDPRTNTLLLNETAEKVVEIRELIKLLDRPVDQVLIEARIVIATESFARDLGARFGISSARQEGSNTIIGTSGSLGAASSMAGAALDNRLSGRPPLAGIGAGLGSDRLNVNLPVANPAGAIGFAILGSDYLLDLELSALQNEGRGEVVSSPRVITSNQREATINQGREVGYVTTSGVGANATPTVNFKEALLQLKVTPTITQDGRVFLSMAVKKDEIIGYVNLGQLGSTPELAKREVTTAVLVDSGQTVVVGGVYEFTSAEDIKKVPFLGDVPVLGNLFRNKHKGTTKAELLIFVTPKILNVGGPRGS
ncbi:MAG: type IV pilus secretin PilQ [Xanthomonadaceae bacterium]|nr:type IV pilus secretin PilQ [Xanthomonadaceae bacterium]